MNKNFLRKGNLKRDFFILSTVILITVALLGCLTVYNQYKLTIREYNDNLANGLKQARSIFDNNLSYVEDKLKSLSVSLSAIDVNNLENVYNVLSTARIADNGAVGPIPYTNFDWANPSGKMVVNTTLGVMKEPRDISFRKYITKARMYPQKVIIDDTIVGIPSGKLLIPITMGINSKKGNFIGTVTTGVDLERLTKLINAGISNTHIKYVILDENYTDIAKNWVGINNESLAKFSLQLRNQHLIPDQENANNNVKLKELIQLDNLVFSEIEYSKNGQFAILVGYDKYYLTEMLLRDALPALLGILIIGLIVCAFIFIIYKCVICTLIALGDAAKDITKGIKPKNMPRSHISEMFLLSKQLIKMYSYTKRNAASIAMLHEKQKEIAAQKEYLEELTIIMDEADKANEYILRDIRHTTNEGLNVITLSAAMLESYFKGRAVNKLKNEDIIKALENIQNEVNNIQNFTTDCLKYEMIDPVKVIREVITAKRKPIAKNGIILNTIIPEKLPFIAVDRVRFNQIISGIIDRSITFLEGGHEIIVSIKAKNIEGIKHLEFFIKDNGFGLKQQTRDSFINKEAPEILDGVNLSVRSIEKLVKLHGGRFNISDSAGTGSQITVLIPYKTTNISKELKKEAKKDVADNIVSLFET